MKKQEALLAHIRPFVGHLYVIGGQNHKAGEAYIRARAKARPDYFSGGRLGYMLKRAAQAQAAGEDLRCFDCSGLFWHAVNASGLLGARADGRQWDATAHGTYRSYCTPIKRDALKMGDCVFYHNGSRITHMAIVGEGGVVYEAAGGAYGVVALKSAAERRVYNLVKNRWDTKKAWNRFGRPKFLSDEQAAR